MVMIVYRTYNSFSLFAMQLKYYKQCVFYCSKSKTIHGGTPVQTIMYISITKGLNNRDHCRQRAPVGIVLSSSGTSQLGMFDIQATRWHASANYHVYKHYKGFVYFNYTYKLLFIALFDDLFKVHYNTCQGYVRLAN
jgi:hypothetical protein